MRIKTAANHVIDPLNKTRITVRGLGATVTAMVGAIVRAVEQGLDPEEGTL